MYGYELNTGMKMKPYTISMVDTNYVSEQSVKARKNQAVYVIGLHFFLSYGIPAWGGVKIAEIADWDYPSSVLIPCISVLDAHSHAQGTVVTINKSGEVIISPHGALAAGDWFYGFAVF